MLRTRSGASLISFTGDTRQSTMVKLHHRRTVWASKCTRMSLQLLARLCLDGLLLETSTLLRDWLRQQLVSPRTMKSFADCKSINVDELGTNNMRCAAAAGTGTIMVSSTSYQTECMPTSAAALIALSGLLRNIGAAIAAAIMDGILEVMGYGWCFTGLAILDLVCIGGLLFIRVRGRVYREMLTNNSSSSSAIAR